MENKTNKSAPIDDEPIEAKEEVKKEFEELIGSSKTFLGELLDFRKDTDREATIDAIKADIPFKGATAWILICSIFVASVGLNANSTAVVIGAMLISPLMGPILGMGMSLAINDIDTLRRSIKNFVVMVILSVLTAYLFFEFFPLREESSELLARTSPDIRDVLIAFFGGLALIIARTKKGTIASVIFGVAIATALMPPLCTVGFGLAIGNWEYAAGALYLFTINTIFIGLATYLVLKILRFPMLKYANSLKRKRISQLASLVAIVVMIPAIWTFWNVLQVSKFEAAVKSYIADEIEINPAMRLMNNYPNFEEKSLELNFFNEINDLTRAGLLAKLEQYPDLKGVKLMVKGNDTDSFELVSRAYEDTRDELIEKKNVISGLQKEIAEMKEKMTSLNQEIESNNAADKTNILFSSVAKDAKIRFEELEEFSYARMLKSGDFVRIDTVTVVDVKWNKKLKDSVLSIKEAALSNWMKMRIKSKDSVYVRRIN
jgi:uncharacterized hydrophobic protein (TIGR00271 family)